MLSEFNEILLALKDLRITILEVENKYLLDRLKSLQSIDENKAETKENNNANSN